VNEIVLAVAEAGFEGQAVLAYVVFTVGIALMIAEIFLPGMILGLTGLAGIITGIIMGFGVSDQTGYILLVVGVVSLPVFLVLWIKVVGPALAHKSEVKDDEQAYESMHSLVGQEGVALTTLRPAGVARLGDRRVDVVTDGEIIDKDTRIKAVEVRGNQVVVRAIRL